VLKLTEKAREQLQTGIDEGLLNGSRLRVFVDHRCHCGKAHFSLSVEGQERPGDSTFDVADIPFVTDLQTVNEISSVEIDFVETQWSKGFTIRNVDHDCSAHMMS